LTLGSYVHALLFRPVECAKRFHVTPDAAGSDADVRKQRKLDKEFAKASGLRLITQSDVATAGALVKSVAADPYLSSLLLRQGRPELSLIWIDEETQLPCKCRLDFLIEDADGLIVVDLKTTRDARMRPFRSDAVKFGYWLQLGFYSIGIAACFPGKTLACSLVAAELESRSSRIYEITPQDVAQGAALARRLMHKYKALQAVPQSEWPGYATQITPLPAPPWAFEEQTDERDAETTD
jgi:exodeoxyribonuclease VIII